MSSPLSLDLPPLAVTELLLGDVVDVLEQHVDDAGAVLGLHAGDGRGVRVGLAVVRDALQEKRRLGARERRSTRRRVDEHDRVVRPVLLRAVVHQVLRVPGGVDLRTRGVHVCVGIVVVERVDERELRDDVHAERLVVHLLDDVPVGVARSGDARALVLAGTGGAEHDGHPGHEGSGDVRRELSHVLAPCLSAL